MPGEAETFPSYLSETHKFLKYFFDVADEQQQHEEREQ